MGQNWHEKHHQARTFGERASDKVARAMGSWVFILYLSIFIAAWISLNIIGVIGQWDPAPFILLNLAFSMQATYSTPIILMSQNRQSDRDKIQAQHQAEEVEHKLDRALALLGDTGE